MANPLEEVTAKLKKVPPLGWVAIAAAGVGAWWYFSKKQGANADSSNTDSSGISAADQGLALSNLAGMPFDYLNPDSNNTDGSTSDYVPATGNTTDTSGVSGTVAAPITSGAPPTPIASNGNNDPSSVTGTPPPIQGNTNPNPAYQSQNYPGETEAQIKHAYEGCVNNCIRKEHKSRDHCQKKCSARHPMPSGGGGLSGFDDWSQIHDDFHYDAQEWIHHLVGHANPNFYDREANSHAIGGGAHMGHQMPQINLSKMFGRGLVIPGKTSRHVPDKEFNIGPFDWDDIQHPQVKGLGGGDVGEPYADPDSLKEWFEN